MSRAGKQTWHKLATLLWSRTSFLTVESPVHYTFHYGHTLKAHYKLHFLSCILIQLIRISAPLVISIFKIVAEKEQKVILTTNVLIVIKIGFYICTNRKVGDRESYKVYKGKVNVLKRMEASE